MPELHAFRMPSLGADMTEGSVLEWLVEPGAEVHHGDLVVVVHTDKADIEAEIFEDATIGELLVEPGVTVPVGTPLATLLPLGTAAPAASEPAIAAPTSTAAAVPRPEPPGARRRAVSAPTTAAREGDRVAATPYARRRAAELGVDLTVVIPAQPGHPITATDVERAEVASSERTPGATRRVAASADGLTPMRRATANLMARSKREIPHYYLEHDIELTHTLAWLARRNAEVAIDDRIIPAALFYRAVALAAHAMPAFNGFWRGDAFERAEAVHLGIAIAQRGGLGAPALLHADAMPIADLMTALRDLTARVRSGRLRAAEMTDATITVTSLGDQGVRAVLGVIHPPQVALVGFGAVTRRPWADGEGIGIRPVVSVSLSADHRATDGLAGARFLREIERRLHEPEEL